MSSLTPNALLVQSQRTRNNLLIAYDLIAPGQNYSTVTDAIRSLGAWYKLQYSLFYVQSDLPMEEAYNRIRLVMDPDDKLVVAHAADMMFGRYDPSDIAALQNAWAVAA